MNLASHEGDNESNILFANFNQDCSSISVGLKTGYRLFTVSAVDRLEVVYGNDSSECSEVCAIDRLYSSSLVAFVSIQSPRKLHVCHFKKGAEICNYSYSNTILGVRLSKQRLVVCLEESLYIHNIKDMILLHTIRDTPSNPDGLFSLSTADNCLVAYPGGRDVGEVQLFDALNLRATGIVLAHNSPLAAIAFNPSGSRIATASVKGTVIRVFSVPDGQRLFDFRRGVKRCATINCLAFSPDSMFLGCSSNTETVHVFRLESTKEKPPEEPQTWMGYVGQALKASVSYLPSSMSDMLNQDRAFAQARLSSSGLKNLCAITCIQKLLCLLVLSQDGYLYIYKLDAKEGGECALLKQHRLDGEAATSPRRSSRHGSSHYPLSDEAEVPGAACGGAEQVDNLRLDDVNEFPPVSSSIRKELN